jgi:RNA-directed DNA polymerase
MPTVRARVGQAAGKLVGEPVGEASVRDSASGVRPKRDAGHAVRAVKAALVGGWWVLDADRQDCCETLDPGRRLRRRQRRLSERRVLERIRQWLTVGVVEEGGGQATPTGSPQGGVRRSLLAHRYLHGRDRWGEERQAGVGRL